MEEVEVRVEAGGGDVMAWRWSADAEAEARTGTFNVLVSNDGVGRARVLADGVAEDEGSMSPAAVEILLVNEEMAQPVQDAASLGWGVAIRGVVEFELERPASKAGGGRTLSAI